MGTTNVGDIALDDHGITSVGTLLTSLGAAEVAVLDGVTPGTVTASKALVVDSNKDIASLRNITATGTVAAGPVTATDITATGNVVIGNAAGDTVKFHGTAGSGAQSAFTVAPAAITGGESPTEEEHNAALVEIAALKDCLINHGLMASS